MGLYLLDYDFLDLDCTMLLVNYMTTSSCSFIFCVRDVFICLSNYVEFPLHLSFPIWISLCSFFVLGRYWCKASVFFKSVFKSLFLGTATMYQEFLPCPPKIPWKFSPEKEHLKFSMILCWNWPGCRITDSPSRGGSPQSSPCQKCPRSRSCRSNIGQLWTWAIGG